MRTWLESRRTVIGLRVKAGDRVHDLAAGNADEVVPLLEAFVRG